MSQKIEVPQEIVSTIKRLYEKEHLSSRKIAEQINLKRGVIERVIRENNFVCKKEYHPEITKEVLRNLYEKEGMSAQKIGSLFHVDKDFILRKLRDFGIQVRGRGNKRYDIDLEELKRLYIDQRLSVKDIALKLECSETAIWKRIYLNDLKRPRKSKYDFLRNDIVRLYTNGESVQFISEHLNCPDASVRDTLENEGLLSRITAKDNHYGEIMLKCLEGANIKELCNTFGYSSRTIARILKKLGISLDTSSLSKVSYNELYNLLIIEGKEVEEVATMYNVGASTIKNKLIKLGLNIIKERDKHLGLTKEVLKKLYIDQKMSQEEIAKQFNCGREKVSKKLKEYGIKKEFLSDIIDNNELKRLYLDENLPQIIVAKKLNVPVNLISKRIDRLNLRNQRTDEEKKESMQKAYGVSLSCRRSKAEKEIEELFPTPHINTSEIIGLELDLWYPEKKIAVEYNGDYWHSTRFPRNSGLHLAKLAMCKNHGIKLINIFERDWMSSNRKRNLIAMLMRNLSSEKLLDPSGTIKKVCFKKQRSHENVHNLDGYIESDKCIGLYKGKELISSVSYNIVDNKCIVSRMTTHKDYLENYDKLLQYIKDTENLPIHIKLDKRYYEVPATTLPYALVQEIEPELFYVLNTSAKRKEEASEEYLARPRCYPVYDCGYSIFEI